MSGGGWPTTRTRRPGPASGPGLPTMPGTTGAGPAPRTVIRPTTEELKVLDTSPSPPSLSRLSLLQGLWERVWWDGALSCPGATLFRSGVTRARGEVVPVSPARLMVATRPKTRHGLESRSRLRVRGRVSVVQGCPSRPLRPRSAGADSMFGPSPKYRVWCVGLSQPEPDPSATPSPRHPSAVGSG